MGLSLHIYLEPSGFEMISNFLKFIGLSRYPDDIRKSCVYHDECSIV